MALVHILVNIAVQDGILERLPTCEHCGRFRYTVAHHDDYQNPLDVRWLCRPCHGKWHAENGPGLNRDLAGFDAIGVKLPSRIKAVFEEMRNFRRDGWTLQKIADKYECTREYVRQIAGDIKIEYPQLDLTIVAKKMTEIKILRDDGKTRKEISELLNIPHNILCRFRLPPRCTPINHGTRNGYNRGCKCDSCRKVCAEYVQNRVPTSRKNGVCILCKKPSSTWRCKDCNRLIYERRKDKNVNSDHIFMAAVVVVSSA